MKKALKIILSLILLAVFGIGELVIVAMTIAAITAIPEYPIAGTLLSAFFVALAVILGIQMYKIAKDMHNTKSDSQKTKDEQPDQDNEEEVYSFKVNGSFRMRYGDIKGNRTKRTISNVKVIDETYFTAFCHLREAQRTFVFSRVEDITDLDTKKTTNNALQLFYERAEGIMGETFDNTPKTSVGEPIEGEYEIQYTNSKTNRTASYLISNVRFNNTRIYGNINNTEYEASIIIAKISDMVDCATGELIQEPRKFFKSKLQKENPSGGSSSRKGKD